MKGQQDLDVTAMIFDHVGDSYWWHLTDVGQTSVAMPLPVLVYSEHTGWHAFSSARFHHGHEAYEGLAIAPEESPNAGKIIEVATGERPAFDCSVTKNVAGLLLASVLLCLMVLGAARWYKRKDVTAAAPKGFIGSMEMMVNFVYEDIIKANIPEHTARYTPYLLTVFFFIFLTNLLGLIPGSANLTGNIAVTVTLALFTFVITNVELPAWLRPLMAVIEFISLFTKPFSLTIRLFANILAGHCALIGVLSVIFITATTMPGAGNGMMSVVSVLLAVFLDCLELLVAFIQAFVFTMLSSIYIGLSQAHHHHD